MTTWTKGTFQKWPPPKNGKSGGKPGDGPGQPGDEPGQPSMDDVIKDIENKLGKRNEIGSDEEAKAAEEKQQKSKVSGPGRKGQPGAGSMSDLESRKSEIENIVPKMNWKSMIRMMVSSSTLAIDTSYAKPSRRGLTGMSVVAQTGKGAMKPGERVEEEKHNKIALVFDTSGSMHKSVIVALAEARKLLKQLGKVNYPITVVFFAGNAKWFQINMGQNSYWTISGPAEVTKAPDRSQIKTGYLDLLTKAASGGTEFTNALINQLGELAGKGYNVMLFSDSDLLHGRNFKGLVSLWSGHKSNVFMIWDSLETWRVACTTMGQVPKTFTHL